VGFFLPPTLCPCPPPGAQARATLPEAGEGRREDNAAVLLVQCIKLDYLRGPVLPDFSEKS
jgi:hypothetical protein